MAGVDGVPLKLWDGREMNLRNDIPRLLSLTTTKPSPDCSNER